MTSPSRCDDENGTTIARPQHFLFQSRLALGVTTRRRQRRPVGSSTTHDRNIDTTSGEVAVFDLLYWIFFIAVGLAYAQDIGLVSMRDLDVSKEARFGCKEERLGKDVRPRRKEERFGCGEDLRWGRAGGWNGASQGWYFSRHVGHTGTPGF